MSLKKLRKIMGCLMLTSAMVMSLPQMAFAAQSKPAVQSSSEKESGRETQESSTEKPTEAQTESQSETQGESQTESQSESQSESGSETQTESETQTTSESSTQTDSESETDTETDTELQIEEPDKDKLDEEELHPNENIKKGKKDKEPEDHSDANANLTANIIAGNEVYLEKLSSTYGLEFADDFEEVMEEIEADYKEWLDKPEDFLATNWQEVLAVYVLRHQADHGSGKITMDKNTKEELEKVFFLMNIRSSSSIANKLSKEIDLENETCALTVEDYAQLRNLGREETEVLEKYTSGECKQLCAIVTASKGFVRGEVGEGVSEERIAIVAAACSLVGKVGYFWGGKSYTIGWDSMWGSPMQVTAAGSQSTGTSRGYGLDCSGFVCWSYYNGLGGTDGGIGNHTTTQWNSSEMVDSDKAQPGDLVFYNSPAAGDQNHVGVVIGKNEDGSLAVAHCSSSKNGVVVGEAWSAGFKYVRSPLSLK